MPVDIKAYSSLSDLIFKGFLTVDLTLDGISLILKTVNEKEYDLIKMYAGDPNRKGYQLRFNIYFLLYSLLMVNNQNVLCNRQNRIPVLYDYFMSFPEKLIKKMLTSLNTLRMESYECLRYLEGFSYTNISRSNWKSLNNNLPSSSEFTGIPGTSELGLNIHQESWVIINRSLDNEEDYNKDFSLALMQASAANPKGSRHIRNQFDSTKKMAEDRRNKLAKEGFIDTKKWTPEGWAAGTDTAEELVAELDRQMTGVKDKHDLFMEEYMNQMRSAAERKTKEAQDRIKAYQAKYSDNVFIDGDQRAMTKEEVTALVNKRVTTTMPVEEDPVSPEDRKKFWKKIGARVLTAK